MNQPLPFKSKNRYWRFLVVFLFCVRIENHVVVITFIKLIFSQFHFTTRVHWFIYYNFKTRIRLFIRAKYFQSLKKEQCLSVIDYDVRWCVSTVISIKHVILCIDFASSCSTNLCFCFKHKTYIQYLVEAFPCFATVSNSVFKWITDKTLIFNSIVQTGLVEECNHQTIICNKFTQYFVNFLWFLFIINIILI